jgi:hypothetical protein
MSEYPPADIPTQTRGLREVCQFDGRTFHRRKGTQDWIEDQPEAESTCPPAEFPHLYLHLVQEEQGPGEPNHWALFLADENEPDYGYVHQVTGDAQYMTYEPSAEKVNLYDAAVTSNVYTLAVVSKDQAKVAQLVKQVAGQEPPPRAEDRKSVTENCQRWTTRVIAKLVQGGIVMPQKLGIVRSMLQPV